MGAAPAPDLRWLLLRAGAEGRAPTEINNVEERFLEPSTGTERPVIEVGFPKADVDVAVAVVAGAEVHLCALVTTTPLTGVSGGSQGLLTKVVLTASAGCRGGRSAIAPSANSGAPIPTALRILGRSRWSTVSRTLLAAFRTVRSPLRTPPNRVEIDQTSRRTPLTGRTLAPEFKW
jgi:hypothetical protein